MGDKHPVIELRQARKSYQMGEEVVHALAGVDVRIEQGEFVAVVGASGSGKSTLMHVLGFMDTLTSGQMFFEGEDVAGWTSKRRALCRAQHLGFVFQSFNLLPRLTVLDNVLLPLSYGGQGIGRTDGVRAREVLSRVGMDHRLQHYPGQLSGGERQRVAIARSLINQPSLIVADEPTGNLDRVNVENTLALFQELHEEGYTFILVTHDDAVAQIAQRSIRLQDGLVLEGAEL